MNKWEGDFPVFWKGFLGRGDRGGRRMNGMFKTLALLAIAAYLMLILYLLKRRMLYVRYVLLWLVTGAVMALLVVCPQVIEWFFRLCGFQLFSNGLFVVLILFILLILLAVTSIVSRLNEKSRRLVQGLALLEKRVRELEQREKGEGNGRQG